VSVVMLIGIGFCLGILASVVFLRWPAKRPPGEGQ